MKKLLLILLLAPVLVFAQNKHYMRGYDTVHVFRSGNPDAPTGITVFKITGNLQVTGSLNIPSLTTALEARVPITRTVNGYPLSANVVIGPGDIAQTSSYRFVTDAEKAAWDAKQAALGFTPENVANKSTSTSLGTSNTLYPTQNAVKAYVDAGLGGKQNSLGFTPENVANKSTATDLGGGSPSNTLYPTQAAVKAYVDATGSSAPSEFTRSTIANLRAAADPSTTLTYYVTDLRREGFFYYDNTDVTSADNGGTIIVNTTTGRRYKRYGATQYIRVTWFDNGIPDYNGTTGTDNTPAANAAIAAAKVTGYKGVQVIFDASGTWYFADNVIMEANSDPVQKFNILVEGNVVFAVGKGFLIEGGAFHKFNSLQSISSKNTGGVFTSYTGVGLKLKNTSHCDVNVNLIENFYRGVQLTGEWTGAGSKGCQYNRIRYNMIRYCDIQIHLTTSGTSTPPASNWVNENYFYGGRLGTGITAGAGGNWGIVLKPEASSNQFDEFNGNEFHNTGYEGLENGLAVYYASGNTFDGARFEAVNNEIYLETETTGGTSDDGDWAARETKILNYDVRESHFIKWGLGTIIDGTQIYSETFSRLNDGMTVYTGGTGVDARYLHILGDYGPAAFSGTTQDIWAIGGHAAPLRNMVRAKINGTERFLDFNRVYQGITASGTTALVEGVTNIRANTATGAQTWTITPANLLDGTNIIIDVASYSGTIELQRSDNAQVLFSTSAITSTGRYLATYNNTNGVFRVDKLGSSGGTVTTASVVSANGFAGSVATASTTPAFTLSTTITGMLKGNGTALQAAVAGTDYQAPLGFTAEDVANKSTSTSLGTSNTLYPSQNAVKSYVDAGLATKQNSLGFTAEDVANKSTSTSLGTSNTLYPSQNAVKSYVDESSMYSLYAAEQGSTFIYRGHAGSSAAWTTLGGSVATNTATVTARQVSTTNYYTKRHRTGYVSSSAAATNIVAVLRGTGGYYQGTSSTDGGYTIEMRSGIQNHIAGGRGVWGMYAAPGVAIAGSTDPFTASGGSVLIFAFNNGTQNDNLFFLHNDGSGTPTAIDLGSNFPTNTSETDWYHFRIEVPPGGTSVNYYVKNLTTGNTAQGTVSTDIPAQSTILAWQIANSSGSTSDVPAFDVESVFVRTKN